MDNQFYIEYIRFHLTDKRKILVRGKWKESGIWENKIVVSLDYSPLKYTEEMGFLWIELPERYEAHSRLRIFERKDAELLEIFQQELSKLEEMRRNLPIHVDEVVSSDTETTISGWYVGDGKAEIEIRDRRDVPMAYQIKYKRRPDVERAYPDCPPEWVYGMQLEVKARARGKVRIAIQMNGEKEEITAVAGKTGSSRKWGVLQGKVQKVKVYYQQFGLKRTLYRSYEKLIGKDTTTYEIFRLKYMPDRKELERQKKEEFVHTPRFDIVVPLYCTPERFLEDMIQSVQGQTYGNWTLYLSDGSGSSSPIAEKLQMYSKKDFRIQIIQNDSRLRIVENTNKALEQVKGDYIVFLDHDDMLAPDALYECARAINRNQGAEIIYTDEDKITMDGKNFHQPHFKPDFNLDLIRSANYMCHLFVVKKTLFDRVGMLRQEYEGSQDYDFILRCIEQTEHIVHVPKVLYHWRVHPDSVAGNPDSKGYAYIAGKKAIAAHYRRTGVEAEIEFMSPGFYRSIYRLETEPLVSIIIPNKDHKKDLKRCIESILETSSYKNIEIVVVENNSRLKETFSYYKELEENCDKVRVLYYEGGFNYSAIQNYAVGKSRGDYILLLNNDTYLLEADSIREMTAYCMRDDVGVVGAKLLYPDDTIQHAGVIVGLGGVAGHAFLGAQKNDPGYFCRITCTQEYSAVTAACMMVKKCVYEEVGGMDTALKVAFNDTDFCLKVGKLGYKVIYHPFSVWYHDESKTRGAEDTMDKIQRFQKEIKHFQKRWRYFLEQGDPCYNLNLTLDRHDFSLRL